MKGHPSQQRSYEVLKVALYKSAQFWRWRAMVISRDRWTCQICHKFSETDMEAHHIKKSHEIIKEENIKTVEQLLSCEKLWDVTNGITLCSICHQYIWEERNKE